MRVRTCLLNPLKFFAIILFVSSQSFSETIPAYNDLQGACRFQQIHYLGEMSYESCVETLLSSVSSFYTYDESTKSGFQIASTSLGPVIAPTYPWDGIQISILATLSYTFEHHTSYYTDVSLGGSFYPHSDTCPADGYYQSDATGKFNSYGHYCTRSDCVLPYSTREGSECVIYCYSGERLDTSTGICVSGTDNSSPSLQLTCEQRLSSLSPSVPQVITDPVVIADGSLYEPESPDYTAAGHFPLQFNRTYHGHNSPSVPACVTNNISENKNHLTASGWTRYMQPSDYTGLKSKTAQVVWVPQTVKGGLVFVAKGVPGYGYQLWRNNFSYALDLTNVRRVLLLPPLSENNLVFVGSGDVLTANNLSGETLTKVTDASSGVVTWVYRDRANITRVFNAAGLLITEQDASGLSHHLAYDIASRLTSVSDDFGHTLSFSYDDFARISVMTTPVGSVTYGYDYQGNLTSVTKVAGSDTTTRTYVYDDARFSYALTGIIDEKGVRYTNWTYDNMGRVTDNHGVNSAEKTTLAYTDTTTTVTNPLGKADIYTYATTGGARRLVSVAGQASTSCLAANSNYSYYSNGLLKSKTDWQGHITAYEYNDRGLVTKVTEAQGTANVRVTTTEWHSTFALPVKVTQGNQVVTYSYDSQGRLTGQQVSGQ